MFTQNWNSETVKNLTFLDRHSQSSILEIGVFEGLTSNYFFSDLLTHDGTLTCVDPLQDDYELDSFAKDNEIFKGQYDRFIENTSAHQDRILLFRNQSERTLHLLRDNSFDVIFVDGHHRYNAVYYDGTESFRLCKDFGYILFDDYLWNSSTFEVKKAIDRVIEENPNHRLLLKLNQVLIQKLPKGSPTEDGQDEYQNKSIEKLFNDDTIYAAYCNLDSRSDRNEKMIAEINRVGFTLK